ncbi:hypothetical protein, partial [Escherichia coli]|uniref:hypothetical protein n=1 Tax=Escherichia coli TaxID=562 RepID=UPI0023615288
MAHRGALVIAGNLGPRQREAPSEPALTGITQSLESVGGLIRQGWRIGDLGVAGTGRPCRIDQHGDQ